MVLLPTSVPAVAFTVRLKLGVVSKLRAALLATAMAPVAALITNAPPVLPAPRLYVNVVPASGSVAVTVPTAVPFALFSARLNVAAVTTGASFTLVRLIVIVLLPLRIGVPLSVAVTVRLKLGVVSKFNTALVATVMAPVAELIAKAPPVFPPVML